MTEAPLLPSCPAGLRRSAESVQKGERRWGSCSLPDICVDSTNVRRCAVSFAGECVSDVLCSAARSGCTTIVDVFLLQACYVWAGSGTQLGSMTSWHVFGMPDSGSAIRIRDSLRRFVQKCGGHRRITWLATANTLFLSVYLPDSSKTQEEYDETMELINKIVKQHRGRGRFRRQGFWGGGFQRYSA